LHILFIIVAAIGALGAMGGVAYYVLCLFSARAFMRAPRVSTGFTPMVSFLKPLRGADPGMYEAFRSHCLQDYPEVEIIFGVSDPQDEAIALVRRLQQEFPSRRIELVVAEKSLGANGKVSTLAQMLPLARFDYLIVNDSDIRVEPDYLRRVMAPFVNPKVGMVTCLYRGIAEKTLGSRIEALGISTDFAAGVLSARVLQGVKFGLGSTLAFPREALEKISGFEPLVDYLADDYELGARIAALGREVVVSDVVVDTHLPAYTFGEFFDHQLRWARAVRDSRKLDYVGMGFTFGLPWALLAVLFARGAMWSWALFGIVAVLRATMAIVIGRFVLVDRQVTRDWWLIPLRDVMALVVWMASFAGHKVRWRGYEFVLKDGKLRPA
jgi:ceramide glucosyltransferase